MHIQKVCGGRSFWFGTNKYGQTSKTITIAFHPNRWKSPHMLWMSPRFNGAMKGKDACLDWNMEILGLHLSYTDWDYGRFKPKEEPTRKETTISLDMEGYHQLADLVVDIQNFCYLVDGGELFEFQENKNVDALKSLGVNVYGFQVSIEHVFKHFANEANSFFETEITQSNLRDTLYKMWRYCSVVSDLTNAYKNVSKCQKGKESAFSWMDKVPSTFEI